MSGHNEPLIRDSDGSGNVALRRATTTEENYLAYHMGLYLADSANIPNALLTTNASGGTAIGSHANTYYNSTIRSGSVAFDDTTTETVTLYQKNSIFDETDSDVRRTISRKSYSSEDRVTDITANLSQVNLLRNRVKADYAQILSVSGDDLTIKIPSDRNLTFDRFVGQSINQHDSGVNGYATLAGTVEFGNALHEPPKMTVEVAVGVTTGRYEDSDDAYVINFRNATIGGTAYSSSSANTEYEVGDNGIYVNALTQQNFQTIINEFDSADMTGLSNRLVSRVFTSDYPGTMKLATAAPSGDYTLVQEAFRDTRGNDDSDVNIYNLYKRTSMSAPDTIRPFSIKRSNGDSGDYQGLQAMTDRQIGQTFGARARYLINPASSSVGAYQLRSAVQGAPTDAGTWVAKGTATDTRNVAVEEDYTRNCQVTRFTNFVGDYTGNYTGTFQNTTTNVYAGNYLRDFLGNFIGTYTGEADYTSGPFTGEFIGNFTRNFDGNYLRDYIGNFLEADFVGTFSRDYLRDFTGNFVGTFQRDNEIGPYYFEGYNPYDGTGALTKYGWAAPVSTVYSFVLLYYENVRVQVSFGSYAAAAAATEITVSGTGTSLDGRTFVRGTLQTSDANYSGYKIAEKFTGADTGPLYVIDYSRNFTRAAVETYIAQDYTRNYTGSQTRGNFPLEFTVAYDYVGNFITTQSVGNYTGNFTNTFSGNFLSEFSDVFTRNSQDNYTTAYTTTFTEDFIYNFTVTSTSTRENTTTTYNRFDFTPFLGNFLGPFAYQGLSNQFTSIDTIDSVGNYIAEFDVERDILEMYVGAYAGNFVGDFVGDFTGFELSAANTTINTYTLYVRVA